MRDLSNLTGVRRRTGVNLQTRFVDRSDLRDAPSTSVKLQHRQNDPTLGRWMQQDPAGYVDGKNLYRALTDSPVDFVDPLGLQTRPAAAGLPTPQPAGANCYSNVPANYEGSPRWDERSYASPLSIQHKEKEEKTGLQVEADPVSMKWQDANDRTKTTTIKVSDRQRPHAATVALIEGATFEFDGGKDLDIQQQPPNKTGKDGKMSIQITLKRKPTNSCTLKYKIKATAPPPDGRTVEGTGTVTVTID
jgi:RHS repeat-associated protein